jgi:hypothetical protein
MHLNYAARRYIDPAIVPKPTGKFERVLAITVYDRQDQIAVFRNCLNRTDEMPHAPSYGAPCSICIDLKHKSAKSGGTIPRQLGEVRSDPPRLVLGQQGLADRRPGSSSK